FAAKYGLPVVTVVVPATQGHTGAEAGCYEDDGVLVSSGQFSGMASAAARETITAWLERSGAGRATVRYRLRDWLISRQRYWGPPIPIVYCERCGAVGVPEEQLPVRLPYLADFRPAGSAP